MLMMNKNDKEFPKENKGKWNQGAKLFKNDWYRANTQINLVEEFSQSVDLSEVELYKLFFHREVEQLFADCPKKYTLTQKNDHFFSMKGINFFFLQTSTTI